MKGTNPIIERGSNVMSRKRANILGVAIDNINFEEAIRRIAEFVRSGGAHYVCVNSVQDILTFKLQKSIKEPLQKIHPIRSVDIRVFERELVRGKVPEADLELIPEEEVKEEKAEEAENASKEETSEEEKVEETAEEVAEETKEAENASEQETPEEEKKE